MRHYELPHFIASPTLSYGVLSVTHLPLRYRWVTHKAAAAWLYTTKDKLGVELSGAPISNPAVSMQIPNIKVTYAC